MPTEFRVIDVERNCLVEFGTQGCKFVALSYVWDSGPDYHEDKTLKLNLATRLTTGALEEVEIPQTIRDAMVVCLRTGWQYLWVDRFCIVQDDEYNINSQTPAMGAIFSSAAFLLMAADSSDELWPGRHKSTSSGSVARRARRARFHSRFELSYPQSEAIHLIKPRVDLSRRTVGPKKAFCPSRWNEPRS